MRYAADVVIPDPFILLDTGKKRYLVVSSLEYGRVKRQTKHTAVLMDPYTKGARSLGDVAAAFLKEKSIRKVTMDVRAAALHVEHLRTHVKVELKPLYPERAIKTQEEIQQIVKVRNATVAALRVSIDMIRKATIRNGKLYNGKKPLTCELIRQEARKLLLKYDCEAPDMIISHGNQTAYPHEQGHGQILSGEFVILDYFPRSLVSGYWFDMTRTVVAGIPTKEQRNLWKAVKKAQDAALRLVKPGVQASSIHAACEQVFKNAGYDTNDTQGFIHSTGHGVGLEIHEAPGIGRNTDRLRVGNVITIEPGLYYPKLGGVRLENTILVTKDGYKDLTRFPRVIT